MIAGLPRLPKWGHLKELHRAIKLCERVLLNGKSVNITLSPSVEVFSLLTFNDSIVILIACLLFPNILYDFELLLFSSHIFW